MTLNFKKGLNQNYFTFVPVKVRDKRNISIIANVINAIMD